MKKYLQMKDFLTIQNPKSLFLDLKDGKDAPDSLLVHVKATHSGIVNGNRRFYRPDKMETSTSTWKDSAFARPVLSKHNEQGEVLGRVREAKYVDVTNNYSNKFNDLNKLFFSKKNKDSKNNYNLFKSIDWVVDNLMPLEDYEGLGYIDLGLQVTNPEAVGKVLRSEYLTVSVGFKTDSAVCSICHQDWAVDDRCDHKPGSKVDGKPVFLITGNFMYDEVSFVNFPADPFATVLSVEKLQDSINKIFFLGLSTSKQDILTTSMSDSIDSLDLFSTNVALVYEDQIETMDIKDLNLNEISKELKSSELTKEKAEAYKKAVENWSPESDTEKARKRSLLAAINVKFTKEGWNPILSDMETEPLEKPIINTDSSSVTTEELIIEDCNSCTATDAEFILTEPRDIKYFSNENKVYNKLAKYIPSPIVTMTNADGTIKDATLSTEQRKKLGSSTFCGPNRSFPVPDKAHYVAALRLLNRAKVSEATKSKIHACILRKGKAAGWASKDDEIRIGIFADVRKNNSIIDEKIKQGEYPGTVIQKYDELDSMHNEMDRKNRSKMRLLHRALHDHWTTAEGVEYAKEIMGTPEGSDALLENFYNNNDALKVIGEQMNFKDSISEDVLKLVDALDKIFHALPVDDKDDYDTPSPRKSLIRLLTSLTSKWDSHCWFEYAKQGMEALNYVVNPKSESDSNEDAINKLSNERDELISKLEAEHFKVTAYTDEVKKSYSSQICILRAAKSLKDYKNIDSNTILQKSKELSQRSIISLKDTLNDILSEISPEQIPDINTDSKPVGDNLNLSDASQHNQDDTTSPEPQTYDEQIDLRYLTPAERNRRNVLAEYKNKLTK